MFHAFHGYGRLSSPPLKSDYPNCSQQVITGLLLYTCPYWYVNDTYWQASLRSPLIMTAKHVPRLRQRVERDSAAVQSNLTIGDIVTPPLLLLPLLLLLVISLSSTIAFDSGVSSLSSLLELARKQHSKIYQPILSH